MSVADAIGSLGTGGHTIIRRTFGALDSAGRETPATTTSVAITASIQPMSGTDLERLPEGSLATDFIVVFSPSLLITADTTTGRDADVIVYRGEEYEVVSVEPWVEIGGYYRAIAQKARKANP
jgi:hypothetical protein